MSGKIITYYGMITRIGIIIMDIATINDVHVRIHVLRVALNDNRATEDSRFKVLGIFDCKVKGVEAVA